MGRGAISVQVQLLAAGVFGLVIAVFGFTAWDRSQRGPVIISTDPTLVSVVVEVRGAVEHPGVYTLPEDGRVGQLIEMAGGVTEDADLRQVNLARRLADEELVIVPSTTFATPAASPPADLAVPTGGTSVINLNTASAADLETLPGIGEVLAERIVTYREANGPFLRVEDLAEVEGISDATLDDIRDLVTVGP